MGRPVLFKKSKVISTRIKADFWDMLQEIAATETQMTGKIVTCQELIRNACDYVYTDNERLRECFRRSRSKYTYRR